MTEKRQNELTKGRKQVNNSLDVYHIFGVSLHLSAEVASKFPEEFADAVARWEPDMIADLIEALERRSESNG